MGLTKVRSRPWGKKGWYRKRDSHIILPLGPLEVNLAFWLSQVLSTHCKF